MNGAFELCGVCGHALRVGARFCGRCGAEQGLLVPRDGGASRELHEPTPRRAGDSRGLTIALVAYFVMLVPGLYVMSQDVVTLSEMMWGELFIGAVGVVGMAAMWRDTLPLLRPPVLGWRDVLVGIGGIAAALGTVYILATALPAFFIDDTLVYRLEGQGLGYALFDAAVVPAIAEELAFRGVVLTALCGVFRERTAVVVSAMLFAILHLSPISFVHLTLLGVVLGAARLRTRSLWPCIAIHLVYNALVVLFQW